MLPKKPTVDKQHVNETQVNHARMQQPVEVRRWLVEEFAARFAATLGGITGERHPVEVSVAAEPPKDGALCWRQPFSGVPGGMWIVAAEESWRNAGAFAIPAAAIDESGGDQLKSEYLEIVRQTASGIAQALTQRFRMEFEPVGGEQTGSLPTADWGAIETTLAGAVARITVGFEPELLEALTGMASSSLPAQLETTGGHTAEGSATFDLLLDVELPVSISFGRAQVALKDVLKLTVGSIVELNRDISDPVEVIVNNCVIARGEVVVVQGNFGVRIQNVISTQERLRTLD
jgi:flagellar motor switch protein FliN